MRRVFGAAFTMAATVAVGLSWATIGNAACGKVSIAEMNWASASLMANVDKIILENGYGCEVELVAGDTMPTFTSMNEKGAPDVAPELWANAVAVPLKKATDEKRLIVANKGPITGLGEGWWVSPYTAKKHNLKTAADVIARPDLFPHRSLRFHLLTKCILDLGSPIFHRKWKRHLSTLSQFLRVVPREFPLLHWEEYYRPLY